MSSMFGGGLPPMPPQTIRAPGASQQSLEASEGPQAEVALQRAISAVENLLTAEKDPQDKALVSKILAELHGIGGARAKEADAALGVSPAVKLVRRATQNAQG